VTVPPPCQQEATTPRVVAGAGSRPSSVVLRVVVAVVWLVFLLTVCGIWGSTSHR
jgi:hypothetical protein